MTMYECAVSAIHSNRAVNHFAIIIMLVTESYEIMTALLEYIKNHRCILCKLHISEE